MKCVIHGLADEWMCACAYLVEDALLVGVKVEVVGHLPGGDDLLCVSYAREGNGSVSSVRIVVGLCVCCVHQENPPWPRRGA